MPRNSNQASLTPIFLQSVAKRKIMKKVKMLLGAILLIMPCVSKAQFMGYETPVPSSSMRVYDTSLQMMYLQGLRERAAYNQHLAEVLEPIYEQAYLYYHSEKYNDCINYIASVFRTYTFYKGQEYLYRNLIYLKGICYIRTGDMDNGITTLVLAKQDGERNASDELHNIFEMYYNDAVKEYNQQNYNQCLQCINRALSTTFYNTDAYILKGQACEALNLFHYAKQWYKIARKKGSVKAIERLKLLKIKQKEYNKSYK